MFTAGKRYFYILVFTLFSVIKGHSQFYNTAIEAKINVENNNEFIKVSGTAFNKTEISQSLRYVLSVVTRNSEEYEDVTKDDKEGRFVLEPLERKTLDVAVLNANETKRIIVLLLIYNLDNNIVGKDRIIFNEFEDTEPADQISYEFKNNSESTNTSLDVDNSRKDGLSLRGIVVEDTKTKPGRDFYTIFYSAYNENKINSEKIFVVKEVMALGTNTKIEIKADDITIFEFFTRPSLVYLKEMSDFSIKRVYYYLQQLEKQKDTVNRY